MESMAGSLRFTGNADADDLLNNNFLALFIGMLLDQQFPIERAFLGPHQLAQRLGFDLEPIGLPGRFMVGCFCDDRPFYVDPWAGGRIYEVDQVEEFLGDYSIEDSGSALLPVTVADTLVRGCRNLIHHYLKAEDPEKSGLFTGFVLEFERVQRIAASA